MKKHSILFFIIFTLTTLHTYCMDTVQSGNQKKPLFLIGEPIAHSSKRNNTFIISATIANSDQKIGSITYMLLNKNEAEITLLDIEKEHQRKKLGTTLMLHAFKHIRSNGISKVILLSYHSAISFYKRLGAERCSPSENFLLFDFNKIGDPEEILKQYYIQKNSISTQLVTNQKIEEGN